MIPRNVCFRQAELELSGGDEAISFAEGFDKRSSLQSARQSPVLGAGETDHWLIKMENLPPNEYELAAAAVVHGEQKRTEVQSRSLALDIGLTKPIPWQGVTASLATKEQFARIAAVETPATVTFSNEGDDTQIIHFPRREGKVDFGDALLSFDRDGRRILVPPIEDRTDLERLQLAPGEKRSFDVTLPPNTRRARLAWDYRWTTLPPGYFLSQHVYLIGK
jgi:hypothetical protein